MSENTGPDPAHGAPGGTGRARHPGHPVRRENLTTQQMRIIGKRRKDAEEKLAHHLNRPGTPQGKHMLQGNPLRITSKVPLTAPAAAGAPVPAAPSSAAPKTLKDDR